MGYRARARPRSLSLWKTACKRFVSRPTSGSRLQAWISTTGIGAGKIEALQWTFGKELLARGLIVIVEWGTWGRSERDQLRLEARALGAAVELHYLFAPVDVLFERIQRRGMEIPPIERAALARWAEAFQAPTPEEIALFDDLCSPRQATRQRGFTSDVPLSQLVRKRPTLIPERWTIRSSLTA